MKIWDIAHFWRSKLEGALAAGTSKLAGWSSSRTEPDGFIEPTLKVLQGDPETARLLIIAAPGAVGKSSYASALASATQSVVVDLAVTSPMGGNFFTGGLSNAFGAASLVNVAAGKVALIVDALDEAQMRAGPQGYEAGLHDLAKMTQTATALPAVLLGRAIAAEDAYLHLAAAGHDACLLEIQFFDDQQARRYIEGKLPLIAARNEQLLNAYHNHVQPYRDLAHEARGRLIEAAGTDQDRFAGYAPVLDAICEFTLQDGCLNPKSKIEELSTTSPIELIRDIITSILRREQEKLKSAFKESHPTVLNEALDLLYTPEEQIARVASVLFGSKSPELPVFSDSDHHTTYLEMVDRFAPQHPFVSSGRAASNPIFAAYVVAWALKQPGRAETARKAVLQQPALISPIFFELYDCELVGEYPLVPLADVGILYQALNSQIAPGQRVQLEILSTEEAQGDTLIEVSFEILERDDPETGLALPGQTWGPYTTSSDTILELRSPFSNIYIDAPIFVQLGDGIIQQIAAPTELSVEWLGIAARQVLVVSGGADGPKEQQSVALVARAVECESVQTVTVKDAMLSVSWDGAKVYPWTGYAVEVAPAADENVDFMRRRLRNILTAFRSHSKGALRRLAAKIDHSRMTKDARGRALVEQLIADKILVSVQSGKFYELDSGVMGAKLGMAYHDLAQSRFTPELDSYLLDLLGKMKT